jgi:hypothetical protein
MPVYVIQAGDEQWRPIPDWEGLYDVSDQGRVKSLARAIHQTSRWGRPMTRRWPETILQPCRIGDGGYLAVSLWIARTQVTARINRLVLMAFVGPPPGPEYQAAHGNGDHHDNRLANLRWATPMANSADQMLHGTRPVGERNPAARISAMQADEIRRVYQRGGVKQVELAARFGLAQTQISRIVRNESWGQ